MLSALATFWMIGNITVAGIAWGTIPFEKLSLTSDSSSFKFNSWRIFVAICGIPALLVVIALLSLPESPKYLLAKGRDAEALNIFREIFHKNTGLYPSEYPIEHVKVERQINRSRSNFNQIISNTLTLFKKPLLWVTVMMLYSKCYNKFRCKDNSVSTTSYFISFPVNFSIQFGYYGLWLWFPELFNKLNIYYNDHKNETVSVCEITNYKPQNITAVSSCIPGNDVFINSFLISISALPGTYSF